MAVSRNGQTLAFLGSPCMLFFNTASEAVTQTVPVARGYMAGISPDSRTCYIYAPGGTLQTVDALTGSVTTTVGGEDIGQAVLSPDGKTIYLAFGSGTGVITYGEGSSEASQLYDVGQPFSSLAVSPDGKTLYAAGQNTLWAVSTATGAVAAKTLPGVNVSAIAASPKGGKLYALDAAAFSFLIINASTGAVEHTVALPQCKSNYYPSGAIAIDPSGATAFVLVYSPVGPCGPVIPINLQTQTVEPAIPGTTGQALAVSPNGTYLYAGNNSSVEAINLTTRKVIGTIPILANSIVFSPDGTYAYIVGAQNNVAGVAVIDTSSLAVTDFISASGGGTGQTIAVTPDGRFVYVAGGPVIDAQSLQVVGQFKSGPPIVIH